MAKDKSLQEKLSSDLKESLKERNELKVSVLRLILTVLHNLEIAKKTKGAEEIELIDEEVIGVLQRELKKRKEAAGFYRQGGRDTSAEQEEAEIRIIQDYLPPQLSEQEIKDIIEKVLTANNDMSEGQLIGMVMKQIKGRADSGVVLDLIKKSANE